MNIKLQKLTRCEYERKRERVKSRSLSRCFRDDFDLENNLSSSERKVFYYWSNFNKLKALFL